MAKQKETLSVEKYYQERITERDTQIRQLAADKQTLQIRVNELKRDLKSVQDRRIKAEKKLDEIFELLEE